MKTRNTLAALAALICAASAASAAAAPAVPKEGAIVSEKGERVAYADCSKDKDAQGTLLRIYPSAQTVQVFCSRPNDPPAPVAMLRTNCRSGDSVKSLDYMACFELVDVVDFRAKFVLKEYLRLAKDSAGPLLMFDRRSEARMFLILASDRPFVPGAKLGE